MGNSYFLGCILLVNTLKVLGFEGWGYSAVVGVGVERLCESCFILCCNQCCGHLNLISAKQMVSFSEVVEDDS